MKSLGASEGVRISPLTVIRVVVVEADEQKAISVQWYDDGRPLEPPRLWHLKENGANASLLEDCVSSVASRLSSILFFALSDQAKLF